MQVISHSLDFQHSTIEEEEQDFFEKIVNS
jgi:hypothetical protein